ncbi:glycosyltransferase [Candidatus Parcubacteria bacterium]|jgi:teichuronic acid biosynthesis glycosyltransferase TuaH|nr:glycosyltransferase [Candidatus Parcubacteria bacterium]
MKKFDVVMFNMSNYSEWDEGVSNRNYHVLRELMNRPEVNKILAVDYLPLTFKRAVRIFKEDLVLNLKDSKVIKRGLTHKVSKISDKLYVYSDTSFFRNPKATLKNIKKTALSLNFGDMVVWSFFPFVTPYLDELGQKLTIFDAVDNWLLHSSYEKQKDKLQESYNLVKDQSDLIFVVSNSLINFFDDQPNVYWIPNGVDLKHYNKKFALINRDISDIKKPIIGYIGVIQNKVDFDLIKYVAEKNPDKSFVLVGPVWDEQDQNKIDLDKFKNVHFLGYKKYSEAAMYIQQFDVGIIPHKKEAFAASTNPMKMYEYLACKKPVVASNNIGTENVEEMIYVANDREEFDRKINLALEENSPAKEEGRKEFVKNFSWFNTVNKMLELINNKLN